MPGSGMLTYKVSFIMVNVTMYMVFVVVVGGVVGLPIQTEILDKMTSRSNFSDMFPRFLLCRACKKVVELSIDTIASNKTLEFFKSELVAICRAEFYLIGKRGDVMCPGFVQTYGPVVLFVGANLILDPMATCEELNFCARPFSTLPPVSHTTPPVQTRDTGKIPKSQTKSKPITFVQLADIHVDSRYAEGTPTDCGLVICCRQEFNGTGSAGRFGDYNCDIPWLTVEVLLDHVNKLEPKPDFIIYSGDSPPHDIWEESLRGQLTVDHDVIKVLTTRLPNIAIYPTLGNHESFPQSQYYQPRDEFQALNKNTAIWWHEEFHIPRDQMANIQYSAYYTTLVRPGLRILSFNTDYWFTWNFYSLLNHKVPAFKIQMEFMEETLRNASIHNEKVIMNAHVSPGNFPDARFEYGDFYTELTRRYSNIIVMHAFGHNHRSGFELMADPDNSTNHIAVMLLAPSITSEGEVNPAYRVYKLDGDTSELLDFDQYYINLTRANELGVARVEHAYSMKSEYSLDDLSPASYHKLIQRMKTDDSLLARYRRNKYALSGREKFCGRVCKYLEICDVSSASTRAAVKCLQS